MIIHRTIENWAGNQREGERSRDRNATEEYIRNRYRIQQTIYRATAGGSELENGENPGN